ncbi:MAG: class I SAM-dependent methyltransferase [Phycisphaerales bacterium]
MDFEAFDTRGYPTVSAREGYGAWAATYDDSVLDLMDLRLLERVMSVEWAGVRRAADLACGTGRTGAWVRSRGVGAVDGVDITPAMLERAAARGAHDRLVEADVRTTGLGGGAYELVVCSLADEHLAELSGLYEEASRLAADRGWFVLVGYHPYFLMGGMPTHYHRASGEAVAIETHVHLLSDHVAAAGRAGWRLLEMHEGVVDDAWVAAKPKWAGYRGRPISFVCVWGRGPA